MPGTGLYAVKETPTQKDDTQSGAPHSELPDITDPNIHGAWLNHAVRGTAEDYSPDEDDMTAVGSPTFPAVGVTLNGSAQYLRRAEAGWRSGDSVGTLEGWVTRDSLGVFDAIFCSSDEAGALNFFVIFIDDVTNVLRVNTKNGGATLDNRGTTVIPAARTHIAIVSDGSNYLFYVNGVVDTLGIEEGSGEWMADIDLRDNVVIGALVRNSVALEFDGTLDDLRYYSDVRTPAEILADFNADSVSQTIDLTTGGLGTADAFKGGYVTNVTRSETRAIIRHIDDSVTLEGSLTNWLTGDDLDIFDAWNTVFEVRSQLETDQGAGVDFTDTQLVALRAGTDTVSIMLSAPTWSANTSNIAAADGDSSQEVDLTWDAAAQAQSGDVGYIAEYRTTAGPGSWLEAFRTNGLLGTVSGLTDGTSYDFRVRAFARDANEAATTPTDTDTATPTAVDTPAAPAAPAITATDLLNQSDVRVDIVADNPLDVSTIFYQSVPGGVLQTWINTVTGSGSETITGLLVKPYVIYAEADRSGVNSLASNLVFLNVVAADQYAAIRNALREWVKSVVGNPEVIWRDGNAPQPTRQYVSIHMGPSTVVGSDYHSNADSSGVETVIGNREFVFGIQIHGQPAQDDGSASISILERLRSSLEKRTIQDTLRAAGLAFVADEGFGDLAGIGGTEFEARVFRDLRFRITYRDTDDVGFIGTVTTPVATYD
ncbi:MAG: fibronectin type III domain-containing protein [Candidatus Hydrogenedentes bacterium]|nr:fibronectin type III domain-containing protein [Candidatus Hydrogenedentota bacterium]